METMETGVTRIEISVRCSNVMVFNSPQFFSKEQSVDSSWVVVLLQPQGNEWKEVDRTEMKKNDFNPQFSKSLVSMYKFFETQLVKFALYDIIDQDNASNLQNQHLLGEVTVTLDELIGFGFPVPKKLISPTKHTYTGVITLFAKELETAHNAAKISFSGKTLLEMDWINGKSDPYLIISKLIPQKKSYIEVFKTEYVMRSLDPRWKDITIPVQQLCDGDYDQKIKIECYDYNPYDEHELIGYCVTSLREIQNKKGSYLTLDNDSMKLWKDYSNAGFLCVNSFEIVKQNTFLDFVRGGYDLNFMVAIDFSSSEDDEGNKMESLHKRNHHGINSYIQTINSVGDVISYYHRTQMFYAYGFGAKLGGEQSQQSNFFPCNFSWIKPQVFGVKGVIDSYLYALNSVMAGDGTTMFSEVIQNVVKTIQTQLTTSNDTTSQVANVKNQYFFLVILCNDDICDVSHTMKELFTACELPLSIVFVGVGKKKFPTLSNLFSTNQKVPILDGRHLDRNFIKFIRADDFSPQNLTENILRSLPDQILEYASKHNVEPNAPQPLRFPQALYDPTRHHHPHNSSEHHAIMDPAIAMIHSSSYYPGFGQPIPFYPQMMGATPIPFGALPVTPTMQASDSVSSFYSTEQQLLNNMMMMQQQQQYHAQGSNNISSPVKASPENSTHTS